MKQRLFETVAISLISILGYCYITSMIGNFSMQLKRAQRNNLVSMPTFKIPKDEHKHNPLKKEGEGDKKEGEMEKPMKDTKSDSKEVKDTETDSKEIKDKETDDKEVKKTKKKE